MNTHFDIGFTGFAGAGKDTAADALFRKSDIMYAHFAFADEIKRFAKSIGWDGNKDNRGRPLLQDIGMAGRNYNPDTWVNMAAARVGRSASLTPVVWTDVRFANEAEFIRQRGGIIIEIARDSQVPCDHVSEISHLGFKPNYVIKNNATIDALHKEVLEIVAKEARLRIDRALFGSKHEQK
jgi:hypothetical protein